jgi:hypothetical protein
LHTLDVNVAVEKHWDIRPRIVFPVEFVNVVNIPFGGMTHREQILACTNEEDEGCNI